MSVVIARTLEFLLVPPGNLLLFLILGLILQKWRGWMLVILIIGIAQALILSIPVVANQLLGSLEKKYPPQADLWLTQPQAQAIVVLGAGRNQEAAEYGGTISGNTEMERLSYAAYLHNKTGLPILLSGGGAQGPNSKSEAAYMQEVLDTIFHVPTQWLETRSHTTWENAAYSDAILAANNIQRAWVVTQAWHMPRAMQAFQKQKVTYIPASTTYGGSNFWRHQWLWYVPQVTALNRSQLALHEWFGLLWYELH